MFLNLGPPLPFFKWPTTLQTRDLSDDRHSVTHSISCRPAFTVWTDHGDPTSL